MDAIDRKILAVLQAEGRLTVTELAQRVALSVAPCHRRLRELERTGAIRGYRAVIDPEAIGLGFEVLVQVTMDREDAATMPDAVPRNARRNRLVRPVTTRRSRSSANSRTLRPSLPCSNAPVTRSNRRGSRRITGSSSVSSSVAVFFTAFGAICQDTRS